jgi:aldehyde dehydrogenase (NAD+)
MPAITDIMTTMDYGPSPESGQPALDWLARHHSRFGLWIGGKWREGTAHFASVNPATGKELARIAQAQPADVDDAVQSAAAALPVWTALGPAGRSRVLYAIARTLQRHSRLLAVLETMDNGKAIRESRDIDVPLAIRHFYHHAGWALRLPAEFPHARALGVVGQIVPWNFPLLMLAWKIAPALACGNAVVFKPAEQTTLSALLFAELCGEAGVPDGVINIVTGDGAVGQAITRHPGIRKIAFTGSTEVGREIRKATAGSGKKLSLELGGKSPNIVFADADLDAAVEGIVDSIWFNQGQVCCAGSRLLVHEGTAERLLAKLRARMQTLRVGDPLDKSTDMGPLVNRTQWQRVTGFVERARSEGAGIDQVALGTLGALALGENTCYYPPTLVTGVDTSSEIVSDEVFGPVLVVQTFRTPAEAVELANHTRYGLAASLWSESIGLALDVAPKLKAGVVWINTANAFDASSGFGGVKESGFGREGGREGLVEYLAFDIVPGVQSTTPAAAEPACTRTRCDRPHGQALYRRRAGAPGWRLQRTRRERRNRRHQRDRQYDLAGDAARQPEGHSQRGRSRAQGDRLGAPVGTWPVAGTVLPGREHAGERRAPGRHAGGVRGRIARARRAEAYRRLPDGIRRSARQIRGPRHQPPLHGLVVALNEPIGVIGQVAPDDWPLLGMVAMLAPAIAMGNRVVLVPSQRLPWIAADWVQVLETSDIPAGVVNLVTGQKEELAPVLAAHADVDSLWCFDAAPELARKLEELSAINLKRTWIEIAAGGQGNEPAETGWWTDAASTDTDRFLRQATQIKNVWVPYGV